MIWYLTRSNHRLAIQPWVRAWLRTGWKVRFLFIIGFTILLGAFTTSLRWGLAMQFGRNEFLEIAPQVVIAVIWILGVLEVIVEGKVTRDDLGRMMRSPNVVLATRGEYIGGHPQLPHGRFVYLTLGGALENPLLSIVLPRSGGMADDSFAMPVLDVQKTSQSVAPTGEETTVNVTLASVTFRAKFLGEQATLNIEYIGQAGRKQDVELTRFFFGNGELQGWHNYVICIQAEADTGRPPHGPWKSLPGGAPPVKETPVVNPPVGEAPPRPALARGATAVNAPGGKVLRRSVPARGTTAVAPPEGEAPGEPPPVDTPPPGELPTEKLPPERWKRLE